MTADGTGSPAFAADAGAALRARLGAARVGIVGLGGLGSNVAWMLVRAGVTHLVLADFDAVASGNLNRQFYFANDVGRLKTDALRDNLLRIRSDLELKAHAERIDPGNFARVFAGIDVFVEAVDGAEEKVLMMALASDHLPGVPIVAASGLAGYGPANDIVSQQIAENVFVVGDFASGVDSGHPLIASRVTLAAAHQALLVARILLGCPLP